MQLKFFSIVTVSNSEESMEELVVGVGKDTPTISGSSTALPGSKEE